MPNFSEQPREVPAGPHIRTSLEKLHREDAGVKEAAKTLSLLPENQRNYCFRALLGLQHEFRNNPQEFKTTAQGLITALHELIEEQGEVGTDDAAWFRLKDLVDEMVAQKTDAPHAGKES